MLAPSWTNVAPAREERPFNREFAITRTSSNTTSSSSSSIGFLLNRERRGEERMTVVERFSVWFSLGKFSFFFFSFLLCRRIALVFVSRARGEEEEEEGDGYVFEFYKRGIFLLFHSYFCSWTKIG